MMGLLWDGKAMFEGGDVVVIKDGHPYEGVKCVVTAIFGRQFEVTSPGLPSQLPFGQGGRMWLWGEDLELISTHRSQVPEVFEKCNQRVFAMKKLFNLIKEIITSNIEMIKFFWGVK